MRSFEWMIYCLNKDWHKYFIPSGLNNTMIIRKGLAGIFILASLSFFQSAGAQDSTATTTVQSATTVTAPPADDHQPVYRVNYWFSGIFSVVATAANLYAIPTFIHGKKDLTDAELASIKTRSQFSGFNRWALDLDPSQRDKFYNISDIVLPSIVALSGGALMLDPKIRKDWKSVLMMYYEMHAATFTLYNYSPLGPTWVDKYRPIVYYPYFSDAERKAGNQKNSQYSGHVASSVASTFFFVKVYSDYHPEIGAKKYLYYTLAALPPLAEGYFRVRALAHFPSDVAIGFGVGAITGIVIPQLHKNKHRNVSLSLNTSALGSNPELGFSWNMIRRDKKPLPSFAVAKAVN
jgi:hypothetical protein